MKEEIEVENDTKTHSQYPKLTYKFYEVNSIMTSYYNRLTPSQFEKNKLQKQHLNLRKGRK